MIYLKKAILISMSLFIMWMIMTFTVMAVPVLWAYGKLLNKTIGLKHEGVSVVIGTADETLNGIFILVKAIYHCEDLEELR